MTMTVKRALDKGRLLDGGWLGLAVGCGLALGCGAGPVAPASDGSFVAAEWEAYSPEYQIPAHLLLRRVCASTDQLQRSELDHPRHQSGAVGGSDHDTAGNLCRRRRPRRRGRLRRLERAGCQLQQDGTRFDGGVGHTHLGARDCRLSDLRVVLHRFRRREQAGWNLLGGVLRHLDGDGHQQLPCAMRSSRDQRRGLLNEARWARRRQRVTKPNVTPPKGFTPPNENA